MGTRRRMAGVGAVAAILAAGLTPASTPKKLPSGAWGGQHVRLSVEGDGAQVEFDCAHGRVEGPLALGEAGRFDWAGRFVREHGGPVHKDEAEDSRPARYKGRIERDVMTLEVVLEGGESAGSFELRRGAEGKLWKCR